MSDLSQHLDLSKITEENVESFFPGAVDSVRQILGHIGENPDREGLKKTPFRVVKSWTELYKGYHEDPADILKTVFEEGITYDEIIICDNIPFYSMCEHHMLPFFGKVHIGYLPSNRVVGLSKLARVVECYARRLQIQEKMTTDISTAIEQNLEPLGVGVIIEAQHMCMQARGVNKPTSVMRTSSMRGKFRSQVQTREEFLKLVGRNHNV